MVALFAVKYSVQNMYSQQLLVMEIDGAAEF